MTLERSEVLGGGRVPLLDLPIGALLRQAASEVPSRTALVEIAPEGPSLVGADSTDRTWTYAELEADALHAARWLLGRFEPGNRVAIWAPNVPEWVIVQFGAALAGVVLVTANPALTGEEIAYVLRRSRCRGLIHAGTYLGRDMAAVADAVRPGVDGLEHVQCLEDWEAQVRGSAVGDVDLPVVDSGDPAQIQFTSGTTGFPKGALLAHRGLVNNPRFINERAGIGDGAVLVSPMPLFHTGGCVIATLGALHARGTYVLCQRFDPALQLGAIQRWGGQVTSGVPTMLIGLLAHPSFATTDLSSLEVVISGGSLVPPELVKRVEDGFGARLSNVYGQTELSPVVAQSSPDDSIDDKANTVGRPLPDVDVKIVEVGTTDVADPGVVEIGVEGEICARGYQQMIGYFEDPDATARTVDGDGWVHTGDLGTIDARGFVRITGRLTDMIIRGGENIYPAEIENVLFEHRAIAEAVVVGVDDPAWGEQVAAVVRVRDGETAPEAEELRRWCRERLASHKTPRFWYRCDALPLTGSGKVQKFRVRQQISDGTFPPLP